VKSKRRPNDAKRNIKQHGIVGVVEIPFTAEVESVVRRQDQENQSRSSSRLSAAAPRTTLPPASVIPVDFLRMLEELGAEYRDFQAKFHLAQALQG